MNGSRPATRRFPARRDVPPQGCANQRTGRDSLWLWFIGAGGRGASSIVLRGHVDAEHGEPAQGAVVVKVGTHGESHPDWSIMVGQANVNGEVTAGLGNLVHGVEQRVQLVRLEVLGPPRSEQPTHREPGTASPGRVDIHSVSRWVELEYHDRGARQPSADARVLTRDVVVDDHGAVRNWGNGHPKPSFGLRAVARIFKVETVDRALQHPCDAVDDLASGACRGGSGAGRDVVNGWPDRGDVPTVLDAELDPAAIDSHNPPPPVQQHR